MAQVLKRRSLVNPGRRRRTRAVGVRRRRNGPKRMSAKQIKYFGTARQKAALRASGGGRRRKRRANAGHRVRRKRRTVSVSRPVRRRRKARRKNVGAIYSIGLAGLMGGNPGRKRRKRSRVVGKKRRSTGKRRVSNMARRRRARRANSGRRVTRRRRNRAPKVVVRYRRRRRTNAGGRRRRRYVAHRRRRNAGRISGAIGSGTNMLKSAFGIIGGGVATRALTQAVLGAKNTGVMGYLGNAIAALVLGWGVKKFAKSPQLGMMVTLGGFTGLAFRLLSDLTPIGQYVNLSLNGMGKVGDPGVGLITDTTFYVPTVFEPGSMTKSQVPSQLQQMINAGSVGRAGGNAGVGSYRRLRARMAA